MRKFTQNYDSIALITDNVITVASDTTFFNLRNKLKLNAGKLQNNNNMHVKNPCCTKQNYTLAHHRVERKHAKIQTHANRGICTNESCVRMLCFTDLSERPM